MGSNANAEDFVFPSRIPDSPHLGTRQYARILEGWVEELGLDPCFTPDSSAFRPSRRGEVKHALLVVANADMRDEHAQSATL